LNVTSFIAKQLLVASCTALLVAATAAGAANASAVGLPGGMLAANPDDPVQQLMLAGEASGVAQFLGISTDQLRDELIGHTLAQVAQQHGKSAAEITAVVVNTAGQQLDTAVSLGQLSSDTAAQYKSQIAVLAPFLVRSEEASTLALQAVGAP
jgi:hypothetical protein